MIDEVYTASARYELLRLSPCVMNLAPESAGLGRSSREPIASPNRLGTLASERDRSAQESSATVVYRRRTGVAARRCRARWPWVVHAEGPQLAEPGMRCIGPGW